MAPPESTEITGAQATMVKSAGIRGGGGPTTTRRGGGKLSAVHAILAEAADLVALERIAKLNTAHLADDSALPSSLESRFRKLKSLPTATTAPVRTLGRSATAPLPHHTNNPPQPNPPAPAAAAPTAQAQGQEDAEAAQEENSPLQAHPPVVTVPAVQEEDLERLFGPGRGRLKLKEQQRKLKKALEEQVKVSRETAKMARWVKQASARMTHTAAIDDLLSDGDDDEDLSN